MAATVLATVSQPMSLAKWLNVPAGKTASGSPASTATAAAHDTVPSPPPIAEHLGALGGRAQHVFGVVVLAEFDDLGLGQLLADLVDDAGAGAAAGRRVDDQRPRPHPRDASGVSTSSGSVLGNLASTIGGTSRAPETAIAAPMPKPAKTSPG